MRNVKLKFLSLPIIFLAVMFITISKVEAMWYNPIELEKQQKKLK